MIEALKGQLDDWYYGRTIIKSFISLLSDTELDKLFPRKYLNSSRRQCAELVQVQSCYVDGLDSGKIKFNLQPVPDTSKEGLIKSMNALDQKLENYLNTCEGTETIDWHGEKWIIHRHISAMIGHEQMHIGQIVAFCYAAGIEIPSKIVQMMALDG